MPHKMPNPIKILSSYRRVLLPGAISLSLPFFFIATAIGEEETNSNPDTVLDPVVVSGEKSDRSLKRTAGSVSVIRESYINSRPDAMTIAELLKNIPNVLYTSINSAPIIRGVDTNGPLIRGNAYLANPVPRATMSVDGRYLSSNELGLGALPIWDVRSIEVFRGPQTTTQGANAIAGAVIINTNDPTFTPEFGAQVLYGNRQTKRTSIVASGPVAQDLAARLALDYSGRDTFITYSNPAFLDRDMDHDFQNLNARLKFLWQPYTIPGFEAKLTYSHIDVKKPASETASQPYNDLKDDSISTDNTETKTDAAIVDLNYDIGNGIKLFEQLQYSRGRYYYNFGKSFEGYADKDYSNFSNEAHINFGDEDSIWSGVSGIYFSDNYSRNSFLNLFASSDFDVGQTSVGVYSELSHRFAKKWLLTGGLRYQYDLMKHDGYASYVAGVHYVYKESFDDILPKISLAYDITDDVTIGIMANKGYLPGGTGLNFTGKRYYTFKKESAWNYEFFTRASLLEGNMILTSNIFYTEFNNSQRSVTDYLNGKPFGSIIVNSDKAESYGAELGLEYQLRMNLFLRGGLGILHTKTSHFGDYRGNVFEGKEFAKAPGYMFNIGVDWDIIPQLRLSGDMRHTDDYYSSDDNDPLLRVGAYTVSNLRLSYKPTNQLEIFAYANNIFDKRVPMEKTLVRSSGGVQGYLIEPLAYGVGMKVRF